VLESDYWRVWKGPSAATSAWSRADAAQVTAILVLFGLPWLLTGSILAHELMHAWLRLNGLTGLSLDVEEGLCQLLALLCLEQQPCQTEVSD
jgi:hypothetical protein